MGSLSFRRICMVATIGGLMSLSGCGGGDDRPVPIDLVTDKNADNVPDELALVVHKLMSKADVVNPGVLDPEEEPAFFEAIKEIGSRLPFSDETIRNLERYNALTHRYETVATEEELTDLMAQISEVDDKLMTDSNYRRFQEALNIMPELNPVESAEDSATVNAAVAGRGHPADPTAAAVAAGKDGFDRLERGDVMLVHSGKGGYFFPWAWHFTHAGNYNGNNQVYESVGSGVRVQNIQEWKGKKRYAFASSKKRSRAAVENSLNQAQARYGIDGRTKYNFVFPNKQTDEKLYCSQLVWKIHKSLGDDVDSNSLKWFALISLKNSPVYFWNPPAALAANAVLIQTVLKPAVAPDEIYYASNVLDFYVDKK